MPRKKPAKRDHRVEYIDPFRVNGMDELDGKGSYICLSITTKDGELTGYRMSWGEASALLFELQALLAEPVR